MNAYQAVKFLHILTVVFMAAPLYNLIVVNERLRFGKAPFAVDRYFENLIKTNAVRCFIFQITAFVTGILLILLGGQSLSMLFTNSVLLAKFLLLLVLSVLLSYVHFGLQPHIEALLSQVQGSEIPPEIAQQVLPWRARRKKLAGFCLFFVITLVLLGLQVFVRFDPLTTALLLALAALFSWRVYKTPIPYGWV
ncbi:MAG: hypothetical protein HY313_01760 [Acidobacteria bacterium]|nr:hypothetical protein [Acidobacteriota bacterium]